LEIVLCVSISTTTTTSFGEEEKKEEVVVGLGFGLLDLSIL
jgi:hypothetical protein